MKIVDLVRANDRCWVVFDEPVGQLTYEKHGSLLIGSDERGIFYDCLYYDRPTPHMRAFTGREFDLPMKDGTTTHCNGQYWYGHIAEAERVVGEEIAEIGASTKDELRRCYVFISRKECAYSKDCIGPSGKELFCSIYKGDWPSVLPNDFCSRGKLLEAGDG